MDDITDSLPRRRPVFGILAQKPENDQVKQHGNQVIYSHVVRYMQCGGALVVPIWLEEPDEYYQNLMENINGLVFPGAITNDPVNSPYAKTAHKLIKKATELNDSGIHFPVVGFCAGFQFLTSYVAGRNMLSKVDAFQLHRKLENPGLEASTYCSRYYGCLSNDSLNVMLSEETMFHLHLYGVKLKDFNKEQNLTDYFNVLSTVEDGSGETIVGTAEAKNYPYYISQWHPDKYSFWHSLRFTMPWVPKYNIIGQELANFFVGEALKNDQHYNSLEEETAALIDNPVSSRTVFLPFREIGHYKPVESFNFPSHLIPARNN